MASVKGWWRKAKAFDARMDAVVEEWEPRIDAKAEQWESEVEAGFAQAEHELKAATADRVRRSLSSVEAAALAGIAAAALLTLSAYLLARQPGVTSSSKDLSWYSNADNRRTVLIGLNLAPFGIVAFLWFMAVVRRRLGDREDRFFATVFLGSGLAFGMLAITAAVSAAIPTLVVRFGDQPTPDANTIAVAHAMWFGLWGISASRLVGVFIVATSTVGLRFGAFPRWLAVFGTVLGALLGITGAFAGPLDFLFPIWLLVVSLTLLFTRRTRTVADIAEVTIGT